MLVPPDCLVQLMQVAGGEQESDIQKLDALKLKQRDLWPPLLAHELPLTSGAPSRRRSVSAPAGRRAPQDYLQVRRREQLGMNKSRERILISLNYYLQWLAAAECHPVPRGISSSALHGGGGGAARPAQRQREHRPLGYTWENDRPLQRLPPGLAEIGAGGGDAGRIAGRGLPRAPNRRALDAQAYYESTRRRGRGKVIPLTFSGAGTGRAVGTCTTRTPPAGKVASSARNKKQNFALEHLASAEAAAAAAAREEVLGGGEPSGSGGGGAAAGGGDRGGGGGGREAVAALSRVASGSERSRSAAGGRG
jgi:hypothetical protein